MVGDGFAFGDAVALAVGDGAVQGVWVGVGGWGELVERERVSRNGGFQRTTVECDRTGWSGQSSMPRLMIDGTYENAG